MVLIMYFKSNMSNFIREYNDASSVIDIFNKLYQILDKKILSNHFLLP